MKLKNTKIRRTNNGIVTFKKFKKDEQIVYGIVYEPYVLDTDGEYMLPEDIQKMHDDWNGLSPHDQKIDKNHDNKSLSTSVVDSFISDGANDDYPAGSWVLGLKIHDPMIWADIKSGRLNGFSLQARTKKIATIVDIEYETDQIGKTAETMNHDHLFFLEVNEDGVVVGGRTSTDLGHSHTIKQATATEPTLGHSHRFAT